MSKYSQVDAGSLYNNCDNAIREIHSHSLNSIYNNLSYNSNFNSQIKSKVETNLNQIADSNTINGSIQNLIQNLEKLKKIASLIENIQDLEREISNLEENKYSYIWNILTGKNEKVTNYIVINQINYKENEISNLEKKIEGLLNS